MRPTLDEILHNRVVVSVPGMDAVAVQRDLVYALRVEPGHTGETPLHMDVYTPTSAAAPAPGVVVLVHGGPVPRLGAKNLGVFRSYGELLAASGMAAVTFDHRYLAADRLD